jgi:hypothetical protein
MLTTLDFDPKLEKKFKTRKNIYTSPLCVTDPKCGLYDLEIRSFEKFLLQTGTFWLNRSLTPLDFEPKLKKIKPIKTFIQDHFCNRCRIWALWMRNTEFRSVFVAN